MTDPIRTALEALVDATRTYLHAMYPSGTGHPADAIGADMERAYRAARAALATPPASPEPERCACGHVHPAPPEPRKMPCVECDCWSHRRRPSHAKKGVANDSRTFDTIICWN